MKTSISDLRYIANRFAEADGTITLSLADMDIVINGAKEDAAIHALSEAIIEYAKEYCDNFALYSCAPNRKSHLPYVMRAAVTKSSAEIETLIICQN